ncbi:molybdopterin oxidoreductase family protein [Methanopyrus kandleri]
MTNSIPDLVEADCYLVAGSNTSEQHPIVYRRILQGLEENDADLIVLDPRRTQIAELADIHLQVRPRTDLIVFLYMAKVIVEEGLHDGTFIEERTTGFGRFRGYVLEAVSEEDVRRIAGVDPEDVREAAVRYAEAERGCILYCMGLTHHDIATRTVRALCALALLTGNVGRPGTGVNPLRGQNNVQGACDMGALATLFPGYRPINTETANEMSKIWGFEVPNEPGLKLTEAFDADEITVMYVVGENPAVSEPNTRHAVEKLESLEFLVVQDLFLTETGELADIVLPVTGWAERTGTFTATDRRVQLAEKAVEPPGEARPDWWILEEVARRLGLEGFDHSSPREIFEEIRRVVPQYRGITYDRLRKRPGGIHWPCPSEDHPGTPVLHTERFATEDGKARFPRPEDLEYEEPDRDVDDEYPLILTTGRVFAHFHTRTVTLRSRLLHREVPEPFVEVHPEDAEKFDVRDGDPVVVETPYGEWRCRAEVTDRVRKGVIFTPFHFGENVLTPHDVRDPESGIPEYKRVPARIRPAPTSGTPRDS